MTQKNRRSALPSAFKLFKPSLNAILLNTWTYVILLGIPLILYFIPSQYILGGGTGNEIVNLFTALSSLAGLVFIVVAAPAVPYVNLKSAQGEQVTIDEAISAGLSYFWRFYGLNILVALIVFVGFLLLIIPGVIMVRRYFLSTYYLYDGAGTIRNAMKRSAADSRKFSGAVWGVIGVTFLIGLLELAPNLGVLAAVLLQLAYFCAPAIRYKQIRAAARD